MKLPNPSGVRRTVVEALAGDVPSAVDEALSWDGYWVLCRPVDEAVHRAVYWAVRWSVNEGPKNLNLDRFIKETGLIRGVA